MTGSVWDLATCTCRWGVFNGLCASGLVLYDDIVWIEIA